MRGDRLYFWGLQWASELRMDGFIVTLRHHGFDWLLWFMGMGWQFRRLMHWRLSKNLSPHIVELRNAICAECPQLAIVGDKRYCKACGCPKWKWSELSVKNTREGHNCPLGKHPGSVATMRVDEKGNIVGGCKGCGGKQNGNGTMAVPDNERYTGSVI